MLGNIQLGAFDKLVYRGPQGEIAEGVARDPYTDGGMFTHAKALELHKLVEAGLLEAQKAGRYCMPPFAQLPLFDLCWGYALPVVHALVWGVEKTFWLSIIDDDSKNKGKIDHYMPPEVRIKIQKLGDSIKCPHDEGRPYTDIIVNKRMWKMENWLYIAKLSILITDPWAMILALIIYLVNNQTLDFIGFDGCRFPFRKVHDSFHALLHCNT